MATAAQRRFCRCACFCSQNLYVARYGLHLRFRDEHQLRRDYGQLLRSRGCVTSKDFQQLLEELEQEVGRRRRLGQESAVRKALIASSYHPARPEVYSSLQDAALAPEFMAAAEYSTSPGADLEGLLQRLETVSDYGGGYLDSHRAFVVKYALGQDLDLGCHYDNAELTLNVALGKDFTGGALYFGGLFQAPAALKETLEVEHVVGSGILHRGGQLHGARPLCKGERWNLVVWLRASAVRNRLCPMCCQKPELVDDEGFGDGFTREEPTTVDVCVLT
ncbi:2-oxoglutarate and iron-dependent oxygenase domain-containing protein 2 isoform 4 [Mus musculus]|uniref:2-oxoglutarate and iron-dependent oxygenase domain-containing protein 2 isoform 4 n=1 Tax=Mus musculus TaxID=10090 RepID=UPI0000217A2D|nr:2-oxoglutarate and iron-dependent oxygenase domain-containing protein 2 isoform 4 [Mus musculus]|eukprot:XP_006530498.1 PREDICTED: 2-oxoglutarate and iron-dependent oxygenase domain-containing protein 2 isoform X1 [Mus musculus]